MLRPSCRSIFRARCHGRRRGAGQRPLRRCWRRASWCEARTKAPSFKPLLWIAASIWITAFAAAAWWQYGENDRNPLSSTDRGPSELKVAQLPAFTALRTIDRPNVALLARGDFPEALAVVTQEPAAYADLPAPPATGLTEIAQQRPELADVRQVATEQVSVHSDLGAADRERPADDSVASMEQATRLSDPEINLASTSAFETESLAPSAPTSTTLHRRERNGEIAFAAHSLAQAVSRAAGVVRPQD